MLYTNLESLTEQEYVKMSRCAMDNGLIYYVIESGNAKSSRWLYVWRTNLQEEGLAQGNRGTRFARLLSPASQVTVQGVLVVEPV